MTTSVSIHFVTRRIHPRSPLYPLLKSSIAPFTLRSGASATVNRTTADVCARRTICGNATGSVISASITLPAPYPLTIHSLTANAHSAIEDICADRDLLKHLIARFRELDPDADRIIQMRLDNPKISDRKIAEALGRKQRTFADQMKRVYTELHRIENK